MNRIGAIVFFLLFTWDGCSLLEDSRDRTGAAAREKHSAVESPAAAETPIENDTGSAVDVAFRDEVLPILERRCNPCHFPGGKMYERLPFDEPETIISNVEKIVRRIKEDPDRSTIVAFVEKVGEATR